MKEIKKLYLFTFFRSLTFFASISIAFYNSNGLSYFQIMALQSIYGIMTAVFEIPSGVLSDLLGRKRTLILGTVCFIAAYLCGALGSTFLPFVFMQIFAAAGQSCYSGTFVSLMYEDVKQGTDIKKTVNEIYANMHAINIFSFLSSALLSSLIVKFFGMRFTYFLTVIAYTLTFFISLLLKDRNLESKRTFKEVFENYKIQLKNNFNSVIKNNVHFVMVNLLLFTIFASTLSYLQQPLLLTNGLNTEYLGIVMFIISGGTLLCMKIFPKIQKFLTSRNLTIITILSILLTLSNFFFASLILNVITFFVITVVLSFRRIILTNRINEHITNDSRATILSVISAIEMFGLAVFSLIIGKIEDISLKHAVLTLVAMIAVLYAVLFIVKIFKMKRTANTNNVI